VILLVFEIQYLFWYVKMDRLNAYYMLSKVQPPYYRTRTPFQSAHNRRIQYNVRELELHFNSDGLYYPVKETTSKVKKGGKAAKITFIEF
jgi:hypothetical protein